MSGLKVVALISGGKDSFFSILHCQANGHEVVALANLHPPVNNGEQSEDIDSYMYQTVGHSVVPLYEKALGLPLYRQEILGSAVDQNKSYSSPAEKQELASASSQDETESLVPLLRKVMAEHPEINAVSTGAILSDYQRTRVESVAIRLGLVPLSYLWQYPFLPPYSETSLLDDMISAGQDARIIKVASGGLDDGFLWENVASARTKTRLVRAMERFGIIGDGAALGEGGEFETLAIDGPSPLWKYSIEVDEKHRSIVTGEAGAVSLKMRDPQLVHKQERSDFSYERLRRPPALDDKFAAIESEITEMEPLHRVSSSSVDGAAVSAVDRASSWSIQTVGSSIVISNAMEAGSSAGEQMGNIMARLASEFGVSHSSIAFTTILLRDMSEFGAVNVAYGSCFTEPTPPARVTVACGDKLPVGVHVSLSVTILQDQGEAPKQGLHVQSRSYWAPANIGPYSQAVIVPPLRTEGQEKGPSFVYVAGQIPLNAPSMDFPERGSMNHFEHFRLQSVLALQHLWRIGQIMNVTHWLGAVAFVARKSETSSDTRVNTALQTWKLAYESSRDNNNSDAESEDDDGGVDLWDRVHGQQWSSRQAGSGPGSQTKRPEIVSKHSPPCFVAEVESLPRDAPIEWASVGVASCTGEMRVSGKLHGQLDVMGQVSRKLVDPWTEQELDATTYQSLSLASDLDDVPIAGWYAVRQVQDLRSLVLPHEAEASPKSLVYTVYTTEVLPAGWAKARQPTIIPCHRVWGSDGTRIAAVVTFRQQ